MPHDLDLEGRAIPMGTLLLLPLVHKGRPMGCVYAFVRCNPRTVTSLASWTELAGGHCPSPLTLPYLLQAVSTFLPLMRFADPPGTDSPVLAGADPSRS